MRPGRAEPLQRRGASYRKSQAALEQATSNKTSHIWRKEKRKKKFFFLKKKRRIRRKRREVALTFKPRQLVLEKGSTTALSVLAKIWLGCVRIRSAFPRPASFYSTTRCLKGVRTNAIVASIPAIFSWTKLAQLFAALKCCK
jgi:hypothetical protein